ncbi:MAG TPA: hypothetical protein VLI41_15630 [Phenylobacterium sp.]|uniref:hypothetical protein n=1 Tax=Phenylobacterium sp. TaxID=1871053 RepID=UPI002B857C82|nr:hypothetical protein [Phenylobacterium sp.]HSV04626.1 hypothetical protein [Phenylobacterium sp.]
MQEPKAFAYSLSQQQEGWAWSIYDENGATVACGAHRSRADAEAAVDRALRRNASGVTEDATA